jgi:hypothetical protein
MNINPDFSEEKNNAEIITAEAMNYIWDEFISPNVNPADEDQVTMVAVIGMTLRAVAEKARAYEKLENGEFDENQFFRN